MKTFASYYVELILRFKGAGEGVLRGPTLEIEFLCFLATWERELPAGFYHIKKYCCYACEF